MTIKRFFISVCALFIAAHIYAIDMAGINKAVDNAAAKAQARKENKEHYPKIAFLIGGSEKDGQAIVNADNSVNFQTEFNEWHTFLKNKNWKVNAFIDQALPTNIKRTKPFIWEDFIAALENLDIKEGDKVFIVVFAHGEKGRNHGILDQSRTFKPVSSLKPVLDALYQKGAAVAFFDNSCYSGQSVEILESNKYCVASTATTAHTSNGEVLTITAKSLNTTEEHKKIKPLYKELSVEDIWFRNLQDAMGWWIQVPSISNEPKQLKILRKHFLENVRDAGDNMKEMYPERKTNQKLIATDFSGYISFLKKKAGFLSNAMDDVNRKEAGNFFENKLYLRNFMGAITVIYLKDVPNKEDRLCANFTF